MLNSTKNDHHIGSFGEVRSRFEADGERVVEVRDGGAIRLSVAADLAGERSEDVDYDAEQSGAGVVGDDRLVELDPTPGEDAGAEVAFDLRLADDDVVEGLDTVAVVPRDDRADEGYCVVRQDAGGAVV
jgi:hypothetical protein